MLEALQKRCAMLCTILEVSVLAGKDKMYTMQEMAESLHVNKTTVYRYLKKQSIVHSIAQRFCNASSNEL